MHRRRGQVLPVWIVGILGTMALMIMALNYGNALRYRIRAQNAADSAAQALLAIQSQRYNEMTELLYGLNIEEYRMRELLTGSLLAATGSAGCYSGTGGLPIGYSVNCETVWDTLTPQFIKAANRYTIELELLHRVAYNATYANWLNDANAMMAHLQSNTVCNTPGVLPYNLSGGDCAFQYSFAGAPVMRTGLSSVAMGSQYVLIPSYGHTTSYGDDTENQNLFAPLQVDVITCAVVPPIIPSFWGINTQPYYAIGRASATNVMFVEDWFEPGALYNPDLSGRFFQSPESYSSITANGSYDFYSVNFGGNPGQDNTTTDSFTIPFYFNQMSVNVGWWNSIPRHATGAPNSSYDTACPTVAP